MEKPIELSVVLPAYHEEENLKLLLPRIRNVLSSLNISFEIIVIDTVSPLDHTEETCRENQVRFFRRHPGNYFGDAVRTGISKADGKYILFMDADGSHAPEYIADLFSHRNQYDLVAASRYVDGGYTENNFTLTMMSWVLNKSYSIILNLKMKDVSNSFKLYRGDMIRELKLDCSNFDIIEEIVFKLTRANPAFRIKEVPTSFKKRMFGETKRNLFLFILTFIFTMIRLRMSVLSPFIKNRK